MSPRGSVQAEVERKVQTARDAMQREVEKIAADVRERVVLPACVEHGLGFKSGNGTYFFIHEREGEKVYWGDAQDPDAPASVRRALAVLDVEAGNGHMHRRLREFVDAERPAPEAATAVESVPYRAEQRPAAVFPPNVFDPLVELWRLGVAIGSWTPDLVTLVCPPWTGGVGR